MSERLWASFKRSGVEITVDGKDLLIDGAWVAEFTDEDYAADFIDAIEAWNTRQGKTCDGCKHSGKIVDYHIDPCCECVRNAPDLYEPKEGTDAVRDS